MLARLLLLSLVWSAAFVALHLPIATLTTGPTNTALTWALKIGTGFLTAWCGYIAAGRATA